MSARGAGLFARYAYPPNELGYCGPAGAEAMLGPARHSGHGGHGDARQVAEVERRARQFEGAWSYLEMIAECAGVDDPLDERVVEAYWLGNELLDAVDPHRLVARLEERFAGQPGGTWREAGDRARAHHSFHVFEVYPWAPLLRTPGHATALSVLESCRIRTGEVSAVRGPEVEVVSAPLAWDGDRLGHGAPRTERARWSVAGRHLIEQPRVGDLVALHWDWVCDVLDPAQAEWVTSLERRQHGLLAPV